jgi:glucosamine--fructose-6-phosphate aminotransferase (isomerizing)
MLTPCSYDGKISVVHNGIIENYAILKSKLQTEGIKFVSDTDTEVIAHLIARFIKEISKPLSFKPLVN